MADTFERVTFLPGPSADQSIVRIEFRNSDGTRQTRTIPLLEAVALARDLEKIRFEVIAKGWL
jgi:hypothetical protein